VYDGTGQTQVPAARFRKGVPHDILPDYSASVDPRWWARRLRLVAGCTGGSPGGAVRAGDWKLIEFYEDGRLELYNLKDDPGERRELSHAQPEKTVQLHAKLQAWRKAVGAKMPTPNPNAK
jgi:arylsulfatase A-like enzyme